MISLSCAYALLLPRCVRAISSPCDSIGTPCENASVAMKSRINRKRMSRIARVVRVAFDAPVAADVVVVAVAIVFAVRLVVLLLVAHEVVAACSRRAR